MITYAIDAARSSGMFERVIVSSDNQEIIQIAKNYGAEVPFVRPTDLADDFTPTVPVIKHALQACSDLGWRIDYACCIYPCVPLIDIDDLISAYSLLVETNAAFSFPVAEFPSAVERALRRLPDGRMVPIQAEYELTRTQDMKPAYFDAAQFYWGAFSSWHSCQNIHRHGVGLPIPNWRVVDIDNQEDWERAEIMFKTLKKVIN